jgi:hypothetical protein
VPRAPAHTEQNGKLMSLRSPHYSCALSHPHSVARRHKEEDCGWQARMCRATPQPLVTV